jgi:hypothetical protein
MFSWKNRISFLRSMTRDAILGTKTRTLELGREPLARDVFHLITYQHSNGFKFFTFDRAANTRTFSPSRLLQPIAIPPADSYQSWPSTSTPSICVIRCSQALIPGSQILLSAMT